MLKKGLFTGCLLFVLIAGAVSYDDWKPQITQSNLEITPYNGETCYQYAERKVNEMIARYPDHRIVGTDWLSAYWAHHYEGALVQRNYFWKPI